MKITKVIALFLTLCFAFSLFGCIPGGDIPPETMTIDEAYLSVYSVTEVERGEQKMARVAILTDISLVSYLLDISLLDGENNTLLEYSCNPAS